MNRWMLSIALLPALAAAAAAQDGGKLNWIGKGQDPVTPALEEGLRNGRPIMAFFSEDGNKECIDLCAGAFSHPAVVEASAKMTCIFVECGNKKNSGSVKKLGVKAFPTIGFFGSDGTVLGTSPTRDGAELGAIMRQIIAKAAGLPPFPENIPAALKEARASGLPLFIYFYDDSPVSLTVSQSINDPELKPLRSKFYFVRFPYAKGSETVEQYAVTRAPTILVVDPRLARPEEKPLARIATSRSPRELRRDLDEVLAAWKPSADVQPTPGSGSIPLPSPKEKLSDDEVDRKFIRARIAVARDLMQRNQAKAAVDVLEDVVLSYPKHVDTVEARKLLEQIKK